MARHRTSLVVPRAETTIDIILCHFVEMIRPGARCQQAVKDVAMCGHEVLWCLRFVEAVASLLDELLSPRKSEALRVPEKIKVLSR